MLSQDEQWLLKEKYNGQETEEFLSDCKGLAEGVPLAYLIGHIPFLGTKIYLDSHPLIPRSETEYWVEKAIQEIKKIKNPKVLDLCAGSGCIGVSVLAACEDAIVHFGEIDESHHQTINKNIRENGVPPERTKIFGSNLFENIRESYDFILTNPPYIDKNLQRTDANVLKHEPHEALFGGQNGMEIIETIITKANTHLAENGTLYIEHEPEQSESIVSLAHTYNFDAEVCNDQYNIQRYSILKKKRAARPTL